MVFATELGVRVNWDDRAVSKGVSHTQGEIRGFIANVKSSMSQGIGQALGQIGFNSIAQGVKQLAIGMIDANAEFEDYNTQFEVMLGSANKAKTFLADIQKMANVTPFETGDLAKASQTLLAFGTDSERIMPIMKMLGDISLGNKSKFDTLTIAFAQMSSMGRLMGQDLLQMVNAGFNPLAIISEKTGVSMATLKKRMEAGAISADMVTEAFKSATSEGGRFYQGMEKGSQTFNGLKSTFMDAVKIIMREIGEPFFKKAKQGLIRVIEYVSSEDGKEAVKNFVTLAAKAALFGASLFAFGKAFFFVKSLLPIFSAIGSALITMAGQSGALIGLSRGATMLAGAFGYVKVALGLLTGPVGWIILAATLIYEAWTHNFGGIRDFIIDTFGKIQQWVKGIIPVFEMVGGEIKRIWKTIWDSIGPYVQIAMAFIQNNVKETLGYVSAGFELLLGALTVIFALLSGNAEKAFSKMGGSAKFYAYQFMKTWEYVIATVAQLLANLADSVSKWIGYVVPGMADEMRKIRDYLQGIGTAHAAVGNYFKSLGKDTQNQMKAENALEAQRQKALEAKKKALSSIKGSTMGGNFAMGEGTGKGRARKGGEDLTKEILLGMAKGIRSQGGAASCGYFASEMLKQTGVQIGKTGNAREIVRGLLKAGGYEVSAGQAKAGDLVYYRGSGYGKQKYKEGGQQVGYHVGVYRGDGYVMDSSGGQKRTARSLGKDAHFIRPSRTGKYANQDDVAKESIETYNKALQRQLELQVDHRQAMNDLWRDQLRLNGATQSEIFQWEYKRGIYPEMSRQQFEQRLGAMQYNETLQKQNALTEIAKQKREQMSDEVKQYIKEAQQEMATSVLQTEQEKMLWELREGKFKSATLWQKIYLLNSARALDLDRSAKADAADRLKGIATYKQKLKDLADQMRELAVGTEEAAIQQLILDESMTRSEAEDVVRKTRELTGARSYKEALKELSKEMLELTTTSREWQIQQLMMDQLMTRAQAEEVLRRKQQIETIKEYRKQLEDTAGRVTDVFMDSIDALKGGFGNFFKSVVDGFRKMLVDMAMQYIKSQVYKFVFGLIDGAGNKPKPQSTGNNVAGIVSAVSSIAGMFGHRAEGGHMNARGLYVVGENGPEVISPSSSAHVFNAGQVETMMSQSSSASSGTTIHLGGIVINGVQDAESFKKNQGQIAADVYRLLEKAARRNR